MRPRTRRLLAAAAGSMIVALGLPGPASASISGAPQEVAGGLVTPWEVVLVPDGRTWVTERDCRVRAVSANGTLSTIYTTSSPPCWKFLGLALHPDFAQNRFVYLYETHGQGPGGTNQSRVVRLVDQGASLSFSKVLLDAIGSDLNHDGGRLSFGPDRKLYVTTGDIHDPARPQNLANLNGKILRLNAPGDDSDGSAPADNPFADRGGAAALVWSYGHRHPQGLAWDALGRLWSTEHGPSGEPHVPAGAPCCRDEVNLVERGANYGWPVIAGSQTRAGMRSPDVSSGDDTTWAPGGAAVGTDGRLYVPMLRGRHLRQFELGCGGLGRQTSFFGDNSPPRLRTVTVGRGYLWFTTDGLLASDNSTGADRLMRVALDTDGYVPPECSAPVGLPSPLPAITQPALPAQPPAAAPGSARWDDRPLARLLARTRSALGDAGLKRLRRERGLVVHAGGWGPGRLSVRLALRRGARAAVTVATTRRTTASRATIAIRVRPTRRGRALLARRTSARLTLSATFMPAGGTLVRRSAALVARAR